MCLRFEQFGLDPKDFAAAVAATFPSIILKGDYQMSANIALTEPANIVFHQKFLRLQPARFGLVPSWKKVPDTTLGNARSDTVDKLSSFADLFPKRRCLIPVTAFYEWRLEPGEKKKTPYRIKTDDAVFYLAGLWDYWAPQELLSFTILTSDPNDLISRLHNRMPVILEKHAYQKWLDPANQDFADLKSFLKPYPPEQMSYQAYDRYVSSARNKDQGQIVPAGEVVRLD
ncbi:MAG TPA: SOS response-associated peptidase [Anaerolineales bacterium]|nr:SOS response-associated peptidase [Anaerolineales bacterium]HLE73712.1 SOS response-associated peptidase [Anaerolineales bacterium]